MASGRAVCLFTPPSYTAGTKFYCMVTERQTCVRKLPKVALDSAAAGIEPVISNYKSDAVTHEYSVLCDT